MLLIPYSYRALSDKVQTRVIMLQPSRDPSAPLHCTIQELDVYGDVEYSAISYTWGNPDFSQQLVVDKRHVIRITPSLQEALVCFRLTDRPRPLWADAVCINQRDDDEKARQIPFMVQIYRCALSVLVWLGNDADVASDLREVRFLCQQLQPISKEKRMGVVLGDSKLARESGFVRPQSQVFNDGKHERGEDKDRDKWQRLLRALQSVTQVPWFTRLWIIQEVAFNPEVLLFCGKEQMSWLRLTRALRLTKDQLPKAMGPRTMIDLCATHTWTLRVEDMGDCDITRLLIDFGGSQCTDGRDRIYALVGLATDVTVISKDSDGVETRNKPRGKLTLCIDYTISTEALYTNFAVSILEYGQNFEHLLDEAAVRCRRRTKGQNTMPSWVPDWRCPRIRQPLKPFFTCPFGKKIDDGGYLSCSATDLVLKISVYGVKQVSFVESVVLSTVDHPLLMSATSGEILEWINSIHDCFLDQILLPFRKRTPSKSWDATEEYMTARFLDSLEAVMKDELRVLEYDGADLDLLMTTIRRFIGTRDMLDAMASIPFACFETLQTLLKLRGRKMFLWCVRMNEDEQVMSNIFPCSFGFGPDQIQPGDMIRSCCKELSTVFEASIILRPVTSNQFELVGDAYLVKSGDIFSPVSSRVKEPAARRWDDIYIV